MADFPIYGLGDKLKSLRAKHKLTQQEVADRLEVSRSSVNRFENDDMTPSTDNLIKFAIMYNTSLDYLLGLGKESYLYLCDFSAEQREFLIGFITGLEDQFLKKEP